LPLLCGVLINYKHLYDSKCEFVLINQSIRYGTSVGANIREAQNAESNVDYIHRFSIAQKECDETIYCLELRLAANYLTKAEFISINCVANELLKMIQSILIILKQKNIGITK